MTLDIAYIARSFTAVENRDPKADELLRRAYAETHVIPVIGLTAVSYTHLTLPTSDLV